MSEEEGHQGAIVYMIFLALIIFFILVGSFMEAKDLIFGHETTVIIIVGMIISWIAWALSPSEEERIVI